jgi:hypothetical protein
MFSFLSFLKSLLLSILFLYIYIYIYIYILIIIFQIRLMLSLSNLLWQPLFSHSLNYWCFTPVPKHTLWCLTPLFAQENTKSSATERFFPANLLHTENESSLTSCYQFQWTCYVHEPMIHIPNPMLFSNHLGGSNKFSQFITNIQDFSVHQEMKAYYVDMIW